MDIKDLWASVAYNFDNNIVSANIAKPGAWNDPDMLEVGNGGLTHEEEETHFALWAISKSPLIIGADLTKISNESLAILKNKKLIDINQDPLSKQATCVHGCEWWSSISGEPVIYSTKTSSGDIVATIYNWRPFSWS